MTDEAIKYCEEHGIYEVFSQKGNVITYYSYYGGFYKITHNLKTRDETRKRLRYRNIPQFLKGEYGVKYNYYSG